MKWLNKKNKRKKKIEELKELQLTNEEMQLITKINKKISSLYDETLSLLNTEEDFIDAHDLKTIFFDDSDKSESLLSKYREIINELGINIQKINIKSKNNIEIEKPNIVLQLPNVTTKIENTIENLNRFFLKNTKIEALWKLKEVESSFNPKKREYYLNKLNDLISELEKFSRDTNFIEIDSIEKDINYIKNIKKERFKYKWKKHEKAILLFFSFFSFIFLILSIYFTINI